MRIRKKMVHGREQWTAECPERSCSHTETATDKSAARSKMRTHDRVKHKPERTAAKRSDRARRRQERKLGTRLTHELTGSQYREAYRKHQEELEVQEKRAARNSAPKEEGRKSSSLRTKGIPGVPDGQKITGLVYDDNGKRVSWATIRRYHNVD
jgi:hypothetical protein